QYALLPDPVAVVGVDFEVQHRLVAAFLDFQHSRRSALGLHALTNLQFARRHPILAIHAPNWVLPGCAERVRLALNSDIVHPTPPVTEEGSHGSTLSLLDYRTRVDCRHLERTRYTHLGQVQQYTVADLRDPAGPHPRQG